MPATSFADGDEFVEDLVRDAAAAPSMHNAQPWRFRYRRSAHTLELSADIERSMPLADPQLRALHVGCGAALFNLRVAAEHAGFRPEVRLLPDPDDRQALASVRLESTSSDALDQALAGLHPAIQERHTSRYPFAEEPLPTGLENRLAAEARAEGARLDFLTGWHLAFVIEVIEEAELTAERSGDPDEERWVRTGVSLSDTSIDGIPAYSLGPHSRDGRAPMRDFARGRAETDLGSADFEHMPHLALLYTSHDHPEDWLEAGQAMERVLLMATREGLASSFATQALERAELRWLLRDPVWGTGPVQMVVRLGYGPLGPRTPRRPVGDVLDIVP